MKKRVLILENDQDTADMLKFLTRQLNVDVVTSDKAMVASDVKRLSPDLIVSSDLLGTELGGDLCKTLKSKESTKEIPVILVSTAENVSKIAKDSKADACIKRPFKMNDLVDLMTRFLYRKKISFA
ncbi:MAG TPA: response regulator [Mucilaginibacter sp.]|nr:response regulator [Mucilaginibacter sp.]